MGLITITALIILCSSISLTLKLFGLGFRLFFGLLAFVVTLLGYLLAGAVSFAIPVIAIIALFIIFKDSRNY